MSFGSGYFLSLDVHESVRSLLCKGYDRKYKLKERKFCTLVAVLIPQAAISWLLDPNKCLEVRHLSVSPRLTRHCQR